MEGSADVRTAIARLKSGASTGDVRLAVEAALAHCDPDEVWRVVDDAMRTAGGECR